MVSNPLTVGHAGRVRHHGKRTITVLAVSSAVDHLPISPSPHLPTLPTLPYSLLPTPYSLFPIPYSLFPIPYSLFPIPYSPPTRPP